MPFKFIEAEKLYQRDPNLRKEDVEKIQTWLKTQKHLPKAKEIQILTLLNKNHYEIEATKKAIEHYLSIRSLCPDIFIALTPDVLKVTASVVCITILPKKTPEGYIVATLKITDERPNNFNCAHVVNLINMILTLYIHQHGFEQGAVAVFEAKGFTFGHLLKLKINVLRYALKQLQGGSPLKLKGIHIINAFPLTHTILALLKPFLSAKLYKKIQVHYPKSDTLLKFVPKEYLPEDYGGDLPSSQVFNELSVKNMLDNYDFYTWHDSQIVDESKRERNRK